MKKILLIAFVLFAGIVVHGQKKPVVKTISKKPVQVVVSDKTVLTSLADSASYALGINIAKSVNKDLGDINTQLLMQGMKDVLNNKTTIFDEETSVNILNKYSEKAKEAEAKKVIDVGRAFLEKNKLKTGVITTKSGLQYEIIKHGTGIKPSANDTAVCHYSGTLIDGTEFDNSYKRGEPLTIPVLAVIKGWTEGLQLMNAGSKYKFYIPYELGYGLRGAPPTIPGGAVLVFEVELLEVKKGL